MNAAVWLGSAIFFTVGAGPAFFSADMRAVLRENFPYFSGAIAGVVITRYYHLSLACAVVALLHLLAEWLYMGRPARKFSLSLLIGLLALTLIGGNILQPRLHDLHIRRYAPGLTQAEHDTAAKSFGALHGLAQMLNLVGIAGLMVYVWRVANPSDTLRFVSSVKFRG